MNIVKGCIFDLDGVLVDTAKYHYMAWKKLAQELGIDFSIKDNGKLKGISRLESLEVLLSTGNINVDYNTKLKFADKKNKWYVEYISGIDGNEILPGVESFILSLKKKEIKIALGSSSKNATLILERTGLISLFDAIIDGSKITKAKPHPEIFLKGAASLGLNPENCVVFEDSEAGLIAAKSAGMYAIGVGYADVLKHADKIIKDFNNVSINDILELK
jgi:beta-phosphoglucomutase